MSAVTICDLSQLSAKMPSGIDHLIVSASYEERAYSVWKSIGNAVSGKKFVCHNENHSTYLKQSLARFCADDSELQSVALNSDDPHTTFESLRKLIEAIRTGGKCHLAVDLTGFTREALAILLYIARYRLAEGSKVTAFYHRAASYGRTPKTGWLSQGVREVRSILGYSGQMRLSADTHLMLIAGFETERAQEIIDTIEPTHLSIGTLGGSNLPAETENPHNRPLQDFIARVRLYYANIKCDEFEFSTSDPIFTRDQLLKAAKASSQNLVLSCLNSKPAMVGACLAAMKYPIIQLIYSQPLYYNTTGYSEPSGKILFFDVPLFD